MMLLFKTGFRPFFLLAPLVPLLGLPWWVAGMTGWLPLPTSPLGPLGWHAHEMLYGFVGAVFGGFFLTAGAAWTRQSTATGPALALLVGLWMLGRGVAWAGGDLPPALAALPDSLYLAGLAFALGRPVLLARSWRNLVFVVVLAALALLQALPWLDRAAAGWVWRATLDAQLLVLVVFTARIVPMFTRNALPEAGVQPRPGAARAASASVALLWLADLLSLPAELGAGLCVLAAGLCAARMVGWRASATLRHPLLWVLHLGVGWIPVGLLLWAAARVGWMPTSQAMHAVAVGALSTLILGMLARVALGHTGRALQASGLATLAFGSMALAAPVRVLSGLGLPAPWGWAISAGAFSAAMFAYIIGYTSILTSPRVDGRPG